MADRYEYYNTGDHDAEYFYLANWLAQTFTPSASHNITSVKLKLYRYNSPGNLTVSIKETSGGEPSGGDLCSGTIEGNDLTTDSAGLWYEITLGAGTDLIADNAYAIVVRALSGDSSNRVHWRYDSTSPTYAGGSRCWSTNSGGSWTITTAFDFMFEEWGVTIVTTIEPPLVATDSTSPTPSMSLGLILSPPVVAPDSEGLSPGLALDKILQAPRVRIGPEIVE